MCSVVRSRRVKNSVGRSSSARSNSRPARRPPILIDVDKLPAELLDRLIELIDRAEPLDDHPEDR
ncbi:hypothetical protein [Bradyrhizobium quebecense]|uniref:Anti-sigma factor NepR domain-containing protein n=2 Tax=Bradyrhizobium quebecense TaxID=2748629 RepID=A0ABS3MC57_9BRAD|nr:hypothetical protein [Bradyrhizobium quebecense]UGY04322.1 hypothetical protein J4P68_0006080 [Bradyrhizobium quebecense]